MTTWWRNYALLAVCWGLPFFFIMVALPSVDPVHIAFGRLLIGAAALWILFFLTKAKLPTNRQVYGHLFVMALLLNSVPGVLFAVAEQHVSSIVAGILNGTTPLFAMLATLTLFREQQPTLAQKIGLPVGFFGVLVVLGVWQGIGQTSALGFGLCAIAVTGYGISFPYGRRYVVPHQVPPSSAAAIQVSFGALQLLPLALYKANEFAPTSSGIAALCGLGLISTGLAYVLHFRIIATAGAIIASTVAYWTPFVAVIAGTLLLSENLHWYEPVGAIVTLLGMMIAQERVKLPLLKRAQ